MIGRLRRLRDRYWPRIAVAILVVCWALFIVGLAVDSVSKALITNGAIQLLVLTLLLDFSISNPSAHDEVVRVAGSDSESSVSLVAQVANHQVLEADLVEFSGVAVETLIDHLASRGCRVRLLVKHPETVGIFQQRRIIANLEALFGRDYSDRIEARCYRLDASLRGRRLGDVLICLGWYTPFVEKGDLARYEVMGHDNALITAPLNSPPGRHLEHMFQSVFDSLWTAGGTEDARVVVSRLSGSQASVTAPTS
jgi:hypothetical protein